MITFQPIASSSAGCSYVVRSADHPPLLIDCGVSFKRIQQAMGFKVSTLAGCLISHAHGDHSKAARDLMKAGIDCYASPDAWHQMFPRDELSHRAKGASRVAPFKVGPWTVQAFDAVHDAEGTLGFLVGSPCGKRLVYLSDTGYSKYRFDAITHLCIECNHSREILRDRVLAGQVDTARYRRTTENHMSLERLLEMLKANNLSRLEEIHLLHLSDANSSEEEFKTAVQRATGVPVHVAPR